MKHSLCCVLLVWLTLFSITAHTSDTNTRSYIIINLDKNDPNKFKRIADDCGVISLEMVGSNTAYVLMTVEQGICVANIAHKIIMEIRPNLSQIPPV